MYPSDITIYPVCFEDHTLCYSSQAKLRPIMAGACKLGDSKRDEYKNLGYLFDDAGENISGLNPIFSELTAVYWLLKNAHEPTIAHAHYRRKWKEDHFSNADARVLYVPDRIDLPNGQTMADQYNRIHAQFDMVSATLNLAAAGSLPISKEVLAEVWRAKFIHPCLMAMGPRESYVRFMSLLFECLWPVWEVHQEELLKLKGYAARTIAFLAERMMTGLIVNQNYFFGDMPIKCGGVMLAPVADKCR